MAEIKPEAQHIFGPRITIRIYNFDHIKPETITRAEEVTREIFRRAGVETSWIECASQEPCSIDADGPEFRVRIVPQELGHVMVSDESLGFAIPCSFTEPACLCYVLYWRIKSTAASNHVGTDRLLGHVMAHEIGHILLGNDAHTPFGIMQHNLPIEKSEQILNFTSGQARHLRGDLLARNTIFKSRPVLHGK